MIDGNLYNVDCIAFYFGFVLYLIIHSFVHMVTVASDTCEQVSSATYLPAI